MLRCVSLFKCIHFEAEGIKASGLIAALQSVRVDYIKSPVKKSRQTQRSVLFTPKVQHINHTPPVVRPFLNEGGHYNFLFVKTLFFFCLRTLKTQPESLIRRFVFSRRAKMAALCPQPRGNCQRAQCRLNSSKIILLEHAHPGSGWGPLIH